MVQTQIQNKTQEQITLLGQFIHLQTCINNKINRLTVLTNKIQVVWETDNQLNNSNPHQELE